MNFVFNNMAAFERAPYAGLMVESIRKHMPDATIIQLGDRDASLVPGANVLLRGDFVYDKKEYPKKWLEALFGLSTHPTIAPNGLVYCDADILFAGDISNLMEDQGFDVAICRRPQDDGSTSVAYRIYNPYNVGLMVVRDSLFWEYCAETVHMWFENCHMCTGQHVIGMVVNSGEFRVKLLDGLIYNRTPERLDQFDETVKVWHFKGDRKDLMVPWAEQHNGKRAA